MGRKRHGLVVAEEDHAVADIARLNPLSSSMIQSKHLETAGPFRLSGSAYPGTSPTEGKALIVPPLELLLVIEGCLKIDLGVFSISCSQFTGTGWNCRVHA